MVLAVGTKGLMKPVGLPLAGGEVVVVPVVGEGAVVVLDVLAGLSAGDPAMVFLASVSVGGQVVVVVVLANASAVGPFLMTAK